MGVEAGWMYMVMGVMGAYGIAMIVGLIFKAQRDARKR